MLARERTQACILGMSLPSPAVAVHILRHLTSVSSLFYYYTCGMSRILRMSRTTLFCS